MFGTFYLQGLSRAACAPQVRGRVVESIFLSSAAALGHSFRCGPWAGVAGPPHREQEQAAHRGRYGLAKSHRAEAEPESWAAATADSRREASLAAFLGLRMKAKGASYELNEIIYSVEV